MDLVMMMMKFSKIFSILAMFNNPTGRRRVGRTTVHQSNTFNESLIIKLTALFGLGGSLYFAFFWQCLAPIVLFITCPGFACGLARLQNPL